MPTITTYKLQLTNDFYVEFNQVARMLGAVCGWAGTGKIPQAALAESIGVSQRRVESLSSIAVGFGLLKPASLRAARLGLVVQQFDPYLSDLGTLWLLHYNLSSNPRYVVWNRLVNHVIPENERFSTVIARPYFDDLAQLYSTRSLREHLGGEMASFWNAYLEQDLSHLNLLEAESEQVFRKAAPAAMPPLVFYATVCAYREQFAPQAVALEVPALVAADHSPGRICFQRERAARELLDQAEAAGYIFVERRADLDQVRLRQESSAAEVLERYYQER